MLLTNGWLHPADRPPLPCGWVSFSGGMITGLGPMDALPPEVDGPVRDLQGAHVCPGFIDAHCHLGLFGSGLSFEGEDCNEATDPVTPQLRALDGVNPLDRYFAEARTHGVTTVLVSPGSANPIAGQAAVLKTAGRWVDEMVLSAPAAMKFSLGENPKAVYSERKEGPITRMATAALIREALRKAQEYQLKRQECKEAEEGDEPEFDAKLSALAPVLTGEIPAHFHAHRADDIATALRICREFRLRPVIIHGTEAHFIGPLLQMDGAPVITGPCLTDRSKPELASLSLDGPALLSKYTTVAICTDHPETPIQHLSLCAALAARGGMDPETALAAITLLPARILGLDARIGSITPGKDADLVITRAHPFDWQGGDVEQVFLNGIQVK